MIKYLAVPNDSQQKGRFTQLSLKNGNFPITEGIIELAGKEFHVRKYFREVPTQFQAGVTENVHALLVCEDVTDKLIAIRLLHAPIDTKYLYITELTDPALEINFGYLTFRVRENDLHIRDYDPLEPREITAALRGYRSYGEDLDLTKLVLNVFADIAKNTYGKQRLVNTYPYPNEADRFLGSGFREEQQGGNLVWVRDL